MPAPAEVATDLAPVVAALQSAVTADPSKAGALFRVKAVAGEGPTSTIRVNRHTVEQDEPAGFGGSDSAPGPVDYALAGLASCQVVVFRYWAAKAGITIDDLRVDVDADFDFRTMFGFEGGGRPGLSDVRVSVRISGPETPERYQQLQQLVDEHCPVFDLFSHATPVSTTLTVA